MLHDTSALTLAAEGTGLWWLFRQSFDLFTILLLLGSVIGLAWVFRAMLEVREGAIVPPRSVKVMDEMAGAGRWEELRGFVASDNSMPAVIVRAAMTRRDMGKDAMRELAELTASEETGRWFRRIEMLSVIGNLGPLVGLAGTVWGMILAFDVIHSGASSAATRRLRCARKRMRAMATKTPTRGSTKMSSPRRIQ